MTIVEQFGSVLPGTVKFTERISQECTAAGLTVDVIAAACGRSVTDVTRRLAAEVSLDLNDFEAIFDLLPATAQARILDRPLTGTKVSLPIPSWCSTPIQWFEGTVEYQRYAHRTLSRAWLEQVDALVVADSTVSLVRREPTINISFDSASEDVVSSEPLPVERFRNGWLPEMPEAIKPDRLEHARQAVAELLAAYDEADTAARATNR